MSDVILRSRTTAHNSEGLWRRQGCSTAWRKENPLNNTPNPYEPKHGRETNPACSDFEQTELAEAWDEGWKAGYDDADASTAKLMEQSRELGYDQGFAAALAALQGEQVAKMVWGAFDIQMREDAPDLALTWAALFAAVEAVKREVGDE